MITVLVKIFVVAHKIKDFENETRNKVALANEREDGVRFCFFSDRADDYVYWIIEEYFDEESRSNHKHQDHYKLWRDAVEPMMARPREHIILGQINA